MTILGTEGVADRQDGRKPGGVVNGSVVKEVTETGPMYMSDPRPRVCRSPMSSPSRVLNKLYIRPRVIAGSTVFAIEKVKNRSKGMLQIVKC